MNHKIEVPTGKVFAKDPRPEFKEPSWLLKEISTFRYYLRYYFRPYEFIIGVAIGVLIVLLILS